MSEVVGACARAIADGARVNADGAGGPRLHGVPWPSTAITISRPLARFFLSLLLGMLVFGRLAANRLLGRLCHIPPHCCEDGQQEGGRSVWVRLRQLLHQGHTEHNLHHSPQNPRKLACTPAPSIQVAIAAGIPAKRHLLEEVGTWAQQNAIFIASAGRPLFDPVLC